MEAKFLNVKYLVPDLKPIQPAHEGEWIDLRAAEDIELKIGEYYEIPLGVAIKLPEGYEAVMAPRSSTYQHWGIIMACHIGVIDNLYSGNDDEWKFPAVALIHTVVHKNDRICQFRIQKQQPQIVIREVRDLNSKSRGGLGSTGKD